MLKLGVQLYLTPALSKACHPQKYQKTDALKNRSYIYTFYSYRTNANQFNPGNSGAFATSWYSPPFERTERLHILS